MKKKRFTSYTWFVLAYTIAVILWGAFVRATGSGAGCGAHWPLCNGQVVPRPEQIETVIEFTHRLTSGFAGFLVLIMLIWATYLYPRGHVVRSGAWLSLFFMITEGAVGAGLVLLELVADNDSLARAVAMATHFGNTLFLVSALTLTCWWASGGQRLQWRSQGPQSRLLIIGFVGLLLVGMSGAITALGDTLFPTDSLREGLQQDFAATSHFLVQLRVWHPVLAVAAAIYLWLISTHLASGNGPAKRVANGLRLVIATQLAAGVVNVLLLAPVWMQIIHLLLANLLLVLFVLLATAVLSQPNPQTEQAYLYAND